jgi:hypothetical protein
MSKKGTDVSVYTLGGTSLLAELENAEVLVENQTEDGSGVNEPWSEAEIVGKSWRIEYEGHIATVAALMSEAADDGAVTVAITTGANQYAGNGIVRTASHQTNRRSLQKQRVTIEGAGALTITAPT